METSKVISLLSIDKAFGILTRNALDLKIAKIERAMPKKKIAIILLDFVNIHKLNKELGYQKVNKRFRDAFSSFHFRKSDIVARYFSGDEIIIITNGNTKGMIKRFRKHINTYGLDFRYVEIEWDTTHTFNSILRSANKRINSITTHIR